MKFDLADNEMTIDMGYRGSLDLTVKFTDQNCITHERTFEFLVSGEKPTILTVSDKGKVIFSMTERDFRRESES